MRRLRSILACGAAAILVVGGATGALADNVYNTLDTSIDAEAEVMSLNVGATGSTSMAIEQTDGDGVKNCNITGSNSLTVTVESSNSAVAEVSPTTLRFDNCGKKVSLQVTARTAGSTTITLKNPLVASPAGSFDLAPATFVVNVSAPAPSNEAPVVTLVGPGLGASYEFGQVPTASCAVTDKEDGNSSFAATITPGSDVFEGIGTFTASCSYTDKGGLEAASSVTYTVTKIPTSIALDCPTAPLTYTGSALMPCTATLTGRDLPTGAVASISYGNNINAGSATAAVLYGGDAHHASSSASGGFTIGKASPTVNLTCPSQVRWTGSAIEPCEATVDGADAGATATPSYSNNADVGTASVTAIYSGDDNHNPASEDATFEIVKANSVVAVSCQASVTYDGTAQQPCTAEVTGVGGLTESLEVTYTNNTNAGTATASAKWAGDATHEGSSDSKSFTIAKASSSVKFTCTEGSVYNGAALDPCTAVAQGVGMADVPLRVSYEDNTNAGTAKVSAGWFGDANHDGSTGSKTFEIAMATSQVTITCNKGLVYTGEDLKPCTAVATGDGMDDVAVDVNHAELRNAGTWTATAAWDGDDNHFGDSAEAAYTIAKADSTVTVSCNSGSVYTGAPITPCSATVTGAGNLNESVDVTYADNTNAGTGTASATWKGDNNHNGDSDSTTFEIAKAVSTVTVSCKSGSVYTGAPITPCSATVTGAGNLNESVDVTYASNTNAGTGTASATWKGDDNHNGNSDSTTFQIAKASSTIELTCPASVWFTGSPIEPCSATVSGDGVMTGAAVIGYRDNKLAGTATATATYIGDDNHNAADSVNKTFTIKGFSLSGFYKPVDLGMLNTVKAGSTVPLKFEVLLNGVEQTDTAAIQGFSAKGISCSTAADLGEAPVEVTSTGGTVLRYDTTGGQFIQNWQTPKTAAGSCYRVTMTTIDGGFMTADFKLK